MTKVSASDITRTISNGTANYFNDLEVSGPLVLSLSGLASFNSEGSVFNDSVTIQVPGNSIAINLKNAQFKSSLSIQFGNGGSLDLSGAKINQGVLVQANNGLSLNCQGTSLQGNCTMSNLSLITVNFEDLYFQGAPDTNQFNFKKCSVTGTFTCKDAVLHNASFANTSFQRAADFYNCSFRYSKPPMEGNFADMVFHKDAYFNHASFDQFMFFNGALFRGSTFFVAINNNNDCVLPVADFSGVKFSERCYFNMSNFKKFVLENCEFIDLASFQDVSVNTLKISRTVFLKTTDFLNATIAAADKETFRIVKNEFLKINNSVEALHYRAKEMLAYEKELTFKSHPSEFLLLQLNRVSNNYGLSWSRGVGFTFGVALFFYIIYLLTLHNLPFSWGWVNWHSFFNAINLGTKFFIKFFIVTHDLDFMKNHHPNAASYIVDFLGRIFIGYGIYQTIQAFRKHGKT